MPVEEIIEKIRTQEIIILKALKEHNNLLDKLKSAGNEDYDWISVREAANLLKVSLGVIYNKINAGEIEVKHIGSKKFVRRSEVIAIDDKYGA